MDYKEIRKSAIIMAIGYIFIAIYSFADLSQIAGLEAAKEISFTFFAGFTLLTIGVSLIRNENKYFKYSFYSFLCLDVFILIYIILGKTYSYLPIKDPQISEKFEFALKINTVLNNTALALSNGLYTYGARETFNERKNKKMVIYATVMEYTITGLLLFSTLLSLKKFDEGYPATIGVSFHIILELLIQGGFAVFMFVIAHNLKDNSCISEINK